MRGCRYNIFTVLTIILGVSAINYIEQIKAPILLIHDTKGSRVDFEQSEDFYDSAKGKIDIKYVEIKNGTHFFDDNESQL